MKSIILCTMIMLSTGSGYSQVLKNLSTSRIDQGIVKYAESGESLPALETTYQYYLKANIILKNETLDKVLPIKDSVAIDRDARLVFIFFSDNMLKEMNHDAFSMLVNGVVIISTDSSAASASPSLTVDLKPSFDQSQPQEMDVHLDRRFESAATGPFAGYFELQGKGAFSTRPDSGVLNSVQLKAGYVLIWADAGLFKYVGLNGNIGSEHPQDFSQTNLIGSLALSSILPWTDIFPRIITGNIWNSSPGLVVQPAVDFVKSTTKKDSSFIRGAIHCNWEIPLMKDQYADLYCVAYFQDGFSPRSYIEIAISQNLSSSVAIIAKWINGELPPLFERSSDLRIGLRLQ